MLPTLRSRPLRIGDAGLCANWLREDCIDDPRVAGGLDSALARLIDEERFQGVVVESHDLERREWVAQGLGVSGFVDDRLIDAHLAAPVPYLLQSVFRSEGGGADVAEAFLGPDAQARANGASGPGLNIVAHWMQKSWNLAEPLWRAVGSIAHEAYVRDHRGHRIQRMFHEDWVRQVDIYVTFGYRPRATFEIADDASKPPMGRPYRQRTLYYMDAGEIRHVAPGTTASFILQHVPPVCQFTRAEQRLLRKALEGLTDQQVASELGLSINTLKSTWRSIYERVQSRVPFALPDVGGDADDGGVRGSEKRRSVLAFVEEHPQEIRPFVRS